MDDSYKKLSIQIASAEQIQEWSSGEIKKPETVNYRTFKPEKGGLFCEKIFGPVKDWECACGKYKRIKHRGIVCDRCGVEVTVSRVRRQRMAHIELAVPVVHVLFFKSSPSPLSNLLGLSVAELEKIIYYEEYVVIDPKDTELERKQLLSEIEYRELQERWGPDGFVASIGGEGIRSLLATENFPSLIVDLKEKLRKTRSTQGRMKLAKRLKLVEGFVHSPNSPTWIVLTRIPVIPPDLRPLVPLDGGRFATSDLNDLYRRVINRNNRLRSILKIQTPDVITRNEKRMLQESVDALFDNQRHPHPVLGVGNRPLKSLSEMLKGKQGRFRQNLLGKRVDYSGRSVIVVGPELKLHQCGLPKQMALDLFEPFIVHRLKEEGYVYTIRSARKMIREQSPVVWDLLDQIIKGHPILLNRAPTLHRLGIQAFEPVLIEGKAIRIHPLVCTPFNADFDGDQMAVHVPLSLEAQIEAKMLMMAPDNIFLPSSGKPSAVPAQDMILGLAYLMHESIGEGKLQPFANSDEVLLARELDLPIHTRIRLQIGKEIIETTPGRVIFNQIVPESLGFQNYTLRSEDMSKLIVRSYEKVGLERTIEFLDDLKNLGFSYATQGATSMGICDIHIPTGKEMVLANARDMVAKVDEQYEKGTITSGERRAKIIGIWTEASDQLARELFSLLGETKDGKLNPLHLMMDSGARGNKSQARQLGAMRGLMTKPSGDILEFPILSNFREGLSVLEYFISSHGARKGLADTALKTADSGYLTRRLVDVAQDLIVVSEDCHTPNGIEASAIKQGDEVLLPLRDRLVGRFLCNPYQVGGIGIDHPLSLAEATSIEESGIEKVTIRSPLTCELARGICTRCYGTNLANGQPIRDGEAVGIIAAQSIGEPGTQLTMRTFHLGGIASTMQTPEQVSTSSGISIYLELRTAEQDGEWVVLSRRGELAIVPDMGLEIEEYKRQLTTGELNPLQISPVLFGTRILHSEGSFIGNGEKLTTYEQHTIPILSEHSGYAVYQDLIEGISTQKETNKHTGQSELFVKQHRSELHPQIAIYADLDKRELLASYAIPAGAFLSVQDGQEISAGQLLARLPRGAIKTRDITGGLPRVAELFEARRPKENAQIAKISGIVSFRGVQRSHKIVIVKDEISEEEHLIPLSKHLIVQPGERVELGQPLTDGQVVPQDILEVCGTSALQKYLLDQVQEIYRLQGVDINDKHIEIIVRQMLQKVRIIDPGDGTVFFGEEVDKRQFQATNTALIKEGSKPAIAAPTLLGITRACLRSDSWVAAASFQETSRILTEAACEGKVDKLLDFKANLITGNLIPGGTGFAAYKERTGEDEEYEEVAFAFGKEEVT